VPKVYKISYEEIAPSRQGSIILSGFGVSIRVENGHLVVSGGRGGGTISRIAKLKRLIVIGHSGYITFDAVLWLRDVGAAFALIDEDSTLLLLSARMGNDMPLLRRRQVLAPTNEQLLPIVRYLYSEKIKKQAAMLAPINPRAAHFIERRAATIEHSTDIRKIVSYEGEAAAYYWVALADRPFPLVKSKKPIPQHWYTYGNRVSPLTNSPRKAITPFHAMLNYLYAFLQTETAIALQIVGLDPGLGLVHQDLENRFSLACDVMEAVRPDVDQWLITFLEDTAFSHKEFTETKIGECRLTADIRQQLSETLPIWRKAIAPVVEHVAGLLLDRPHTTPLTQRNRSAARPKMDARRQQRREETQPMRDMISDVYNDAAAGLIERAAQPKPKQPRQQRRREQTQQVREPIGDTLDDVAAAMMGRAEGKRRKAE
jgi:CRISPR-associated endonuclease Cas1